MGLCSSEPGTSSGACNHLSRKLLRGAIREKTFCCGAARAGTEKTWRCGSGGIAPGHGRPDVEKARGERLACICAIDRARSIPDGILGPRGDHRVHELVGNALVMKGEKKRDCRIHGATLAGRGSRVILTEESHAGLWIFLPSLLCLLVREGEDGAAGPSVDTLTPEAIGPECVEPRHMKAATWSFSTVGEGRWCGTETVLREP